MEKSKPARKVARMRGSRPGRIVIGLAALVLAYVFVSFAINNGSLLDYAITLALLYIGLREWTLAIFKKR